MIPRDVSRDQNDLMVIIDWLASFVVFDLQHGVTQQELAGATGIPEGSIGAVVEKGVELGWLAREVRTRGPAQGGQEFAIYLTPAGRSMAPTIRVGRLTAGEVVHVKSGL
ncbi:MAG: hypothetical protein WC985_00315 [Thermoplasmata archaeon]